MCGIVSNVRTAQRRLHVTDRVKAPLIFGISTAKPVDCQRIVPSCHSPAHTRLSSTWHLTTVVYFYEEIKAAIVIFQSRVSRIEYDLTKGYKLSAGA